MIAALKSDKGNSRETNQDYLTYANNKKEQTIYILCDGMGGYKGGEVASFECANIIKNEFEQTSFNDVNEAKEWIYKVIIYANNHIRELAKTKMHYENMGTTLVAFIVAGDFRLFANVGDSRIYAYNRKEFNQLSDDQTFANALYKAGYISEKEAINHPKRSLLISAIGSNEEDIEVQIEEVKPHYNYLLCSDGLYNMVNSKDIHKILNDEARIDIRANRLIDVANNNGGKDNISVILVEESL